MNRRIPRLALFFNARRTQGGIFQYASEISEAMRETFPHGRFEVRVFDASLSGMEFPIGPGWSVEKIPQSSLATNLGMEWLVMQSARLGMKRPPRIIPRLPAIRRFHPDMVFYLKPDLRLAAWHYRGIAPIHDLQHRLQPGFPEVSHCGESRRRDLMFSGIVAEADAILCDSETGKEDILSVYGGNPAKIHPLPYFAPRYIYAETNRETLGRIASKYLLPDRFFFYPAAFWKHKNHASIVRALASIRKASGDCPHVVFAGSRNREFESVCRLTRDLNVGDRVHFVGYVPDEEMAGMYRAAEALVMPTFFGPTNIPVIEAWACGCPVITSDIRGIRQQIGNAGLLADPNDPESLARAIMRIHENPELRRVLAEKGKQREAAWRAADYGAAVWKILSELVS